MLAIDDDHKENETKITEVKVCRMKVASESIRRLGYGEDLNGTPCFIL